jgi:MFS family permease
VDLGFSLSLSAFLFGILGLLRTVGGLIWGPLSDRIGRGPCVWIAIGLTVAGFGMLVLTSHLPPAWDGWRLPLLWAFTLTFGAGYNGISPMYAAAVADHFAGPSLGTMFGLLDLGFGLGAAIGPWVAGWMYDQFASYEAVLWGLNLGVFITGIGLVFGGRTKAGAAS